ncbi:MAG TPA: hypothetical protein GX701_06960 [Clostridiales bacterium]|jgi:hypothetical protein|nr:hypothetical protein [Clostridiales bacterium]
MPFEKFDRSRLLILPLSERVSDIDVSLMLDPDTAEVTFDHPKLDMLAERIVLAKEKKAASILMYGAHVIRSGCGPFMIRLMEQGFINHLATNGAGAIHDFEFALKGVTCESVAKYISEGQFGLWQESGMLNDILREGVADGLGAGEAIGRYIWENNLPYRDSSVLANAYRLQIPATVHIGIGNDIIHEHPNCDGAVLGEASYTDFLIYAKTIENLDGGVFLNFGSAVAGPEVYLKCLAMARNVAKQEGRTIFDITTAVFDLLPIEGEDYHSTPPKSDPRYYFRPWKTILARTTADGGRSCYIQGNHRDTLPALARKIFAKTGL